MAYRHNDTLHKHQVRAKRLRKVAFAFSTIVAIALVVVFVDWAIGQLSTSNTVVSRENKTSVQSANVSVYRTEFFQFQAPESWVAVSSETTASRFVYVKNSGNLVTQKFTVIVNRPETNREADFNLTRAIPIHIGEKGEFQRTGDVSTHCNDSFPKDGNRDPRRIVHDDISFVCNPDSQQYNINVGIKGGSDQISATLKNGKEINLFLVYGDLTAYPSTGDLYKIIESFSVL